MADDRLFFLPLGGAGEIGLNCYVYGFGRPGKERLLVVDVGVAFPDMDTSPGVDLILPDVSWLAERANRIEGIAITHAHEDHVGALGHAWPRLKAPVFARRFTAGIAASKLEGRGPADAIRVVEPLPEELELGPFRVGFLPVSHSIPESSALVIDTPLGRIFHTGDFKLDTQPGVGEPFDRRAWADAAVGGIRALVCDSTNVFVEHHGRSEHDIVPEIQRLVGACKGAVAATTFASHVARVKALADAGVRSGRSVVLLGRAMRRMVAAATEAGVLRGFPNTIEPEEARKLPRDRLMLLTTGSQGEHQAATAQLSRGRYLGLDLREGDTFLFSSKTIPGNERSVIRIVNRFSEMGVDVVDADSGLYHDPDGERAGRSSPSIRGVEGNPLYHVSGHANRPDLDQVHRILGPKMVIPMHGEHRHLRAHARLAAANGRATAVAPNGALVDLSGDAPRIVEHVETGRDYLDGDVRIGAYDGVVRDRLRLARGGHVAVSVVIDEDGAVLGDPWCETMGLPENGRSGKPLVDALERKLGRALKRAGRKALRDDDAIEDLARKSVRNTAAEKVGKKPEVIVIVTRLG